MSNKSFIDLKTPKRRNFSDYFLERNPFPTLGVPEDVPLITVDRETIIEQFKNVVFTVLDGKKSILTVLVGEYGSGKSHLLKVFKRNINEQILSMKGGTIAGYIKSPGDDFRDFVLAYIDNIGRDILQGLARDIVKEFLKKTPEIEKYVFSLESRDKLKNGNFFSDEIMRGARQIDLSNDIIDTHLKGLRNNDIAKAFLGLANPSSVSLGWRWLSGDKLTSSEKNCLDVTGSITSDNAYETFADFMKMLRQAGIDNFAIFVDELERITELLTSRRDRYQNDLRQLIDDNPTNTIFYFAIAPRQWKVLTLEQTAFVRRLSGNWLILDEFETNDIRELIESYLYTGRPPDFSPKEAKSKYPKLTPSLCPFDENSIPKIGELTEGVVSRVLILCEKSLNYLHDHKKEYDYVDADLVQKAYSQS
jgi:ABC-type dipeptide/oligopeptide/nickel transport system ATPase component